jgi:anti-anti-sigma factor
VATANIQVSCDDPAAVVVSVAGEVDLAVHDALQDSVQSAVKTADVDGVNNVIVDLSQTTFMDSTGIRVLVDGYVAAGVAGVGFVVAGASGMVRNVLEITGVFGVLTGEQPGS